MIARLLCVGLLGLFLIAANSGCGGSSAVPPSNVTIKDKNVKEEVPVALPPIGADPKGKAKGGVGTSVQ